MNLTKNKKGFTLIELLIVIVVIGILAGILVPIINVSEHLKETRDARRVRDILNLQTAIIAAITSNEIILSNTSSCATCNSIDGTIAVDGSGWTAFNNTSGQGLINYIQNLPKDPTNEDELRFSYYSDGQKFELNAVLESNKYAQYAADDGGNDETVYERGWDLTLH